MRTDYTRRRVISALGASGVVALAGCADSDDDSDNNGGDGGGGDGGDGGDGGGGDGGDGSSTNGGVSGTVRIGMLQALSGDAAYYGGENLRGWLSGFSYKGESDLPEEVGTETVTMTVGDVDYEILVRDSEFSPDTAQTVATELVQNENVDMLAGTSTTAAAERVAATVAKPSNIPFVAGGAGQALTQNEDSCGELIFHPFEHDGNIVQAEGTYYAEETDAESAYLFGANYSYGENLIAGYTELFEDAGIEIVGNRTTPRGFSEWRGLLDNAEEAGADLVMHGYTVVTLPQIYQAFLTGDYSFDLFGNGFGDLFTIRAIGSTMQQVEGEITQEYLDETGIGPLSVIYAWNQYDNPVNDAFIQMYEDTYGGVPDVFGSGTFAGASGIVQGVREAASTNAVDIAGAMQGMAITDTPKGENAYAYQENNDAISPINIAQPVLTKDDRWGAPYQPSEPIKRYSKEEVAVGVPDACDFS